MLIRRDGVRRGFVIRLGAIALLAILLAIGAYLLVPLATGKGLEWSDKASSVGSFLLAVGVAVLWPAFRRVVRMLSRAPLADPDVPGEMERLAMTLRHQLDKEEKLREIYNPNPLPIRWDVTSQSQEGLDGHYEQILQVFDRLRARRLVVLGPGGAGKSMLLARLAHDLLKTRRPGEPVPVIVSMATWNPDDMLDDWLAGQLASKNPGLADPVRLATGDTVSLADALLMQGRILPLLDGFDELPPALRQRALAAVNAHGSNQPLVLASRPEEYRVAVAGGRAVSIAAVLELRPLQLPEAERYLEEATGRPERWRPVFERLACEPDGPLGTVLTNPLLLWLARKVYGPPDSDPAELAADHWVRTQLEAHLLDALVPALYGRELRGRRAERWLAFLAAHLQRAGPPEVAWWRLPRALRGWLPIAVGIRVALRVTAAWVALVWLLAQHGYWRDGTFAGQNGGERSLLEVFLGGPVGQLLAPVLDAFFDGTGWPNDLVDDVFSAIRPGIASWLVLGLGLLAAAVALIDFSTHPANVDGQPVAVRVRPLRLLRAITEQVLGFIVLLLLVGGLVLTVAVSADRDAVERAFAGESLLTLVPWVLLFAVTTWTPPVAEPVDVSRAVSSPEVLRLDRQAFHLKVVYQTTRTVVLLGLIGGQWVAGAYLGYAMFAILLRLTLGTPAISPDHNASQSYAGARFWLAMTGHLPWRTMAFLSTAHEHGVLRQIGAVYQFRHVRLQEHLAAKFPYRTGSTAAFIARLSRWLVSVERVHAAGREARAAGLMVEHVQWNTQRFRDSGLPARLDRRRAVGDLVADDETRAAMHHADALVARVDQLNLSVRLQARIRRRFISASAARRFVGKRLNIGDDLEDFAWHDLEAGRLLRDSEVGVAMTRLHLARLAPAALVTAGLAGLLCCLVVTGARPQVVVVVVPLLASAAWLLVWFLDWRKRFFIITDQRLIIADRFGRSTTGNDPLRVEVPLADIADVSCIQSPFGALLGYGRLHVNTLEGCPPVRYVRWSLPWGRILDLGRWDVESQKRSFQPTAALPRPLLLLGLTIHELDAPSDVAGQPGDAWDDIAALIRTRRPRQYDEAVTKLKRLRAAEDRSGDGEEFRARIRQLRHDHARKPSLLKRMDDAGL
ncbi:NACHT domain-containing protein [Kribbella sp. NPDC051952]|uniref:NACHT domain-containing protein n=1 Tax=Kribbella sp. NPDC051952 TaxID=3154851 RepID=UPI003422CDA1